MDINKNIRKTNDKDIEGLLAFFNIKDDKRHRRGIRRGLKVVCDRVNINRIGSVKIKREIDLDGGIEGVGSILFRSLGSGRDRKYDK